MKKRRTILLSGIFCVVFCVFFLSSSFFKLSRVEVVFFDESNNYISLNNNKVLNTTESLIQMTSVANGDLGTSMFLIDKSKYSAKFESKNPYAKLLGVEAMFPNKLVFSVKERVPVFYLTDSSGTTFLLDSDFKILKIAKNLDVSNLIPLLIEVNSMYQESFFDFFEVSIVAFSEGQFLTENNLVIKAINGICDVLNEFSFDMGNNRLITCLTLSEENGQMNLVLTTNHNYGVKLKVEDILIDFNKKFGKLLNAFRTLELREKIKTSYGTLTINKSNNCFWNKL